MNSRIKPPADRYRVWITSLGGLAGGEIGQSRSDSAQAVALEPAEEGTMSARQAARYVAAFNRVAAALGRGVRAVALPVAVRYEGDAVPGRPVGTP